MSSYNYVKKCRALKRQRCNLSSENVSSTDNSWQVSFSSDHDTSDINNEKSVINSRENGENYMVEDCDLSFLDGKQPLASSSLVEDSI